MRKLTWKVAALAGASVAALAWGGVAHAAPSTMGTDYVDGFEEVNDDFNDHAAEIGSLCSDHNECPNSDGTDTVLIWQSILSAEGYLGTNDVIGVFGPRTASATAQYQANNGLADNGILNDATWTVASSKLETGGAYVNYNADEDGYVRFVRDSGDSGAYTLVHFKPAEGPIMDNTNNAERIEHFALTIEVG